MPVKVKVRFETPYQNRCSLDFGPYPFVQLTYNGLRVGPDRVWLAEYDYLDEHGWVLENGEEYTDIVIWGMEEEEEYNG